MKYSHSLGTLWRRISRTVVLRAGLSSGARFLKRSSRSCGVKIRWRLGGVTLEKDGETLFLNDDPSTVACAIQHFEKYTAEVVRGHDERFVDLRSPRKFVSQEAGVVLWFSSLPEPISTCAGYLAKHRPTPGDVVFDAGAYCGETTYVFAKLVGEKGHVYAFEPDAANFEILCRNITMLGLKNVTPIQQGLWSSDRMLCFTHGDGLESKVSDGSLSGTEITVRSFETICSQIGVVPNFIKMDVEGAELEVIRAAIPSLKRHDVRLAIASYHVVNGRRSAEQLEELFAEAEYSCETGYPEHLTTWAWPSRTTTQSSV